MLFISAFFALSMGATVIVAHAFGARQHDRSGGRQAVDDRDVRHVLVIAVVVFVLATPMLRLMGADSDVVAQGARFQQISAIGYVFMALMFSLGGVLRGVGDTRTPMLVTAGINVINVAVAWPLIFGLARCRGLELDGAAIGPEISRFVGCVVMVWILVRGRAASSIAGRDGWRSTGRFMRRLADICIPAMGESLLRSGGQILFVVIVFMLGTAVVAGHNIAQQAVFLSMFPGFGFSMAATALVGQSLGAGEPGTRPGRDDDGDPRLHRLDVADGRLLLRRRRTDHARLGPAGEPRADHRRRRRGPAGDRLRPAVAGDRLRAGRCACAARATRAGRCSRPASRCGSSASRWPISSPSRSTSAWPASTWRWATDNGILMALNIWRWRQGKWQTSRLASVATHPSQEPSPTAHVGSAPLVSNPSPQMTSDESVAGAEAVVASD